MAMVDVIIKIIHSGTHLPHPDTHHLVVQIMVAAVEALQDQRQLHLHQPKDDNFENDLLTPINFLFYL